LESFLSSQPELVAATAFSKGSGLKLDLSHRVAHLQSRPVIDWAAVEKELRRIRQAHPLSVRRAAVAMVGAETRAAWREALGRMVLRASDEAAHRLMQVHRAVVMRGIALVVVVTLVLYWCYNYVVQLVISREFRNSSYFYSP